nr:MAG TPA: holin [Caudoviricetes sp.]
MEKFSINLIFSTLATVATVIFGGFDLALQSLLIIILIDYITGVLSAIYNKKLSSKIGLKGILKKFCYLLIVALAVVLDNLLQLNSIVRNGVIYFLIANDGISVIENVGNMGIKLPKKITQYFEQLKNEEE